MAAASKYFTAFLDESKPSAITQLHSAQRDQVGRIVLLAKYLQSRGNVDIVSVYRVAQPVRGSYEPANHSAGIDPCSG